MALLISKQKSKKTVISLRFEDLLITEIKAYSEWIGVDRLDNFFDQAARYVLEKDRDWQKKLAEKKE
jgi:hypothetical protein